LDGPNVKWNWAIGEKSLNGLMEEIWPWKNPTWNKWNKSVIKEPPGK